MKRIVMLLLGIVWLPVVLSSQIRVDRAEGHWEVSRDITPAQAEQRALFEAKREALRQAGIPERVSVVSLNIQTADSLYFDHFFTEISTLQILAQVKVLHQEISRAYNTASGRIIVTAVITADVLPPSEEMQLLPFHLSGLNHSYRSGENLRFSLTAGSACYFHFFVFDTNGGSCFFPNNYEKRLCFQPDTTYAFPLNHLLAYTIDKGNTAVRYEQNIVIAVATRTDVPFRGEVTVHNLFDWLYSIPPDQRVEAYYSFLVE